jgi:hypothetical protein
VAIDHATHALGRNTPATSDRLNLRVRYRRLRARFLMALRCPAALPRARLRRASCAAIQLRRPFAFGVTTLFFTEVPCHRVHPAVASSRAWPQAAPLQAWASGRGRRGR